jgi:Spy/CpxP family protein refolding chaperone
MKRLSVATLSIVLIVASVALAQPRRPGPPPMAAGGPGPGNGNGAMAEYLALTADQKAAWETIQNETRDSMRALHEQERTLAQQLESATDAAAIGNLVLQLRGIATQMHAAREAADATFAATLTAEQQVKFAAFQAASEFLQRRGPNGPPPPR